MYTPTHVHTYVVHIYTKLKMEHSLSFYFTYHNSKFNLIVLELSLYILFIYNIYISFLYLLKTIYEFPLILSKYIFWNMLSSVNQNDHHNHDFNLELRNKSSTCRAK